MLTPADRLRALMAQGCVAMPGSFNGLCARAVAQAGFQATYVSGAATSVCAGVPDVGVLSLEHFCRVIREVYDSSGLPLIADADTGFGEAEMVRRTVIDYFRAGAAGLHIEDQQFPKRCGHLDGKVLVPLDHMCEKIQWAATAARALGTGHRASVPSPRGVSPVPSAQSPMPSIIVCARTDARGVRPEDGGGFDAALVRAKAYVEAGAEMIFPEGLASEEEFARFASSLRASVPSCLLLANMTEFGKTPIIPLSRFAAMGYSCVIYPVSLLRVAMGAVQRALGELKASGSVEPFISKMQTRQELYDLVGYTPGKPWEFPVR
ncbi:MAG: oxaloacetate decarboxylase [Phycisphaerales bacterium]